SLSPPPPQKRNSPINNRILPGLDHDPLHFFRVLEADLAHGHASILLQVAPRRVHNRHIVLFVPLDRIRLCQLRAINQQLRGYGGNVVGGRGERRGGRRRDAEVDVGGGELVNVELCADGG